MKPSLQQGLRLAAVLPVNNERDKGQNIGTAFWQKQDSAFNQSQLPVAAGAVTPAIPTEFERKGNNRR
jgi:hypothetical protein